MATQWQARAHDNQEKARFEGVGKYDIPALRPVILEGHPEMIGFNFASKYKHPEKVGVHFFLQDYMFIRTWTSPDIYTPMLQRFRFVCSPDFSLYTDHPLAVQIMNHFRKHWLGAYWQAYGMTVIPTICWSDKRSYDFCFDGEPVGGTVAVSSIGTQSERESRRLFADGFEEMLVRLNPKVILFHGEIPKVVNGLLESAARDIRIIDTLAFLGNLRKIGGEADGRTRLTQRT